MARRYYRVATTIWRKDWDDDTRLVALYLLTGPHRSTEGIFRLPLDYARSDLGWSPKRRFDRAFGLLLAEDFVAYDEDASVCLIVNALAYQAPENPNQRRAAIKALGELPETPLLDRFGTLARTHAPRFYEHLHEAFPNRYPTVTATVAPTVTATVDPTVTATVTATVAEPLPKPLANTPSPSPSTSPNGEVMSPEIERLCQLHSDLCRKRTDTPSSSRKYRPTEEWRRDMRRLVELDGRSVAEVEAAIKWVDRSSFWAPNVLSPAKLRHHFDRLRLAAQEERKPKKTPLRRTPTEAPPEMAAALERLQAKQQAEDTAA